jgi:hypothetical protein
MALANTLTQSLRARYPNNFDKNERRLSRYAVWDFFKKDTRVPGAIFDTDILSKIKQSFGNQVVIPVIDGEDVTIGNVRSCTVPDKENTSQLVTLTFVTYAFGFTMYPAQHYNNDIKYQADYDVKLKKYLLKLAAILDSQCVTVLDTNKNQIFTDLTQYYPEVGDALQITQAQKNDFFNNAEAILHQIDFYDSPHVIASTSLAPLWRRLDNQGSNNGINESFQLPPYTTWMSNRVTNAANVAITGYLVQEGTCAVENRNDPDAIMGSRVGEQMVWEEVAMPIVDLTMGSFYREDCSDASGLQSGTSGLTRTKKESFEFSTDVCFQTVYNKNLAANVNPIVKFQIATT